MKLQQLNEGQTIPVVQIALPYAYNALEPVLSERTVKYHYDVLTTAYFTRYNKGEGDREFNRAGGLLHNLYWAQLRAPRAGNKPNAISQGLIEQTYKNFDNFKDQFTTTALAIQGSGWVYWSTSGEIKTIANHAWKSDVVLCIDMWEHSFLMNLYPDKKRYLNDIWKIINWDVINDRLFVAL